MVYYISTKYNFMRAFKKDRLFLLLMIAGALVGGFFITYEQFRRPLVSATATMDVSQWTKIQFQKPPLSLEFPSRPEHATSVVTTTHGQAATGVFHAYDQSNNGYFFRVFKFPATTTINAEELYRDELKALLQITPNNQLITSEPAFVNNVAGRAFALENNDNNTVTEGVMTIKDGSLYEMFVVYPRGKRPEGYGRFVGSINFIN